MNNSTGTHLHRYKKILLILAVVLAIVLYFAFDLDKTFTLTAIQTRLGSWQAHYAEAPLQIIAVYFVTYVVMAALALPGAQLMTLLAGAMFGLGVGTLIVSFASSIGATLAFLGARYLFRDWITQRYRERLNAINSGIEKDGTAYLFMLRLVPIFPYFLINVLLGLTTMRARAFYGISQLGMLAGTIAYVNAGVQFATITTFKDILSAPLLLSFALLGFLPFIGKAVYRAWQQHLVYRGWQRPKRFDRNMIVIGAGAAGLVTSYIAATVKARVTLVERHKMGGDCLNYGCVPSKALIASAKVAHRARHAAAFGISVGTAAADFPAVMKRVHQVIAEVAPHDSIERYSGLGVEVMSGEAKLLDPWTVEVKTNGNSRRLTARTLVLATGARPFVPPLPGLDEVGYVTSDTIWQHFAELPAAPKHLVVLGGGPIGCELTQAFARLGVAVTQVEMADRLMVREDQEVSSLAKNILESEGVTVLTGHKAIRCQRIADRKVLTVEHQDKFFDIEFDEILCAVGRVARLSGFGLETLGIECDRTITTNEYLQTRYPNIYAAGDVAGPYQFTHAAAHQAWFAAVNGLFGQFKRFAIDYRVMPWTTFLDPEIARVGLNEQDAKAAGIAYEVTRFDLADLDRAIAEGETRGFVKVLTVPGKDRILGVTIVGSHAGEMIAEYAIAMKAKLGLSRILATTHAYPTHSEANRYAAGEWKRQHAPHRVLALLARYHKWRLS